MLENNGAGGLIVAGCHRMIYVAGVASGVVRGHVRLKIDHRGIVGVSGMVAVIGQNAMSFGQNWIIFGSIGSTTGGGADNGVGIGVVGGLI